ncbi:unnamed protein product [Protopolystoma xenopodis]|uniref:Uncharacterized protein n=1 Tax=Protopolystoma xenopodis TaxID=117903 RepID=A0A3S5CR70_9PLAT|nr:unnamed protein product [Protopolystoma xenopodis]
MLTGRLGETHLVQSPLYASPFPQSDRGLGTFPNVPPASSVSLATLSTTQQLVKETSEADPLTNYPSALSLVHLFHSTPATPFVPHEALFPKLCLWETNFWLRTPTNRHGQVFASCTTFMVRQDYSQPTSSSLRRVYPVSIHTTNRLLFADLSVAWSSLILLSSSLLFLRFILIRTSTASRILRVLVFPPNAANLSDDFQSISCPVRAMCPAISYPSVSMLLHSL